MKKTRSTISILILGSILTSCISNKARIKNRLNEIDIKLTEDIEIIECKDYGITDYIFETEFLVSQSDKLNIIDRIQHSKDFNNERILDEKELKNNKWTYAYETDSSLILNIRFPTNETFIDHYLEIFKETNKVKYEYWIE